MPPGSFRKLETHDGQTIRVRWVKKVRLKPDPDEPPVKKTWAWYDPESRTVTVAYAGCTPAQLVDSLLHELFHDILDNGGDEVDVEVQHDLIDEVVPQLVELLVNNPKLTAWIDEQVHAERERRADRMKEGS